MENEILVLIDGNSLLNRAYYALPPLNSSDGKNVNAVFGFMNILLKAIADIKPKYIGIAFDKRGKTFRHEIYQDYKATRKGMPDDLAQQMPVLFDLLDAMQIKRLGEIGVEADDIIGTLAKRFEGNKTVIISGDRDLLQLVGQNTEVWLTKKGITEVERVTAENIEELYKLTPEQIITYKALRGDPSDNIPGVAGVGEKTAADLIGRYGDLQNLYAHIEEITGALRVKLETGKDAAFMSQRLAEIKTDCEVECARDECLLTPFSPKVKTLFEQMQFRSLNKRLDEFSSKDEQTVTVEIQAAESVPVESEAQLRDVVAKLSGAPQLAVWIGENISLAAVEGKEYNIILSQNLLEGISFDAALKYLRPLFESSVSKIVYDGKGLRHLLAEYGADVFNVEYDVSIMQYLVEYRAFKDFASLKIAYNLNGDAAALITLSHILTEKLKENDTDKLYLEIEMPLSSVLFDMEQTGCKIDTAVLEQLHEKYHSEINELTAHACELAGEQFNVLSGKQLSEILFNKLNLPVVKKTKTGFSTDSDVLEYLSPMHPLPEVILRIRKLSKLDGTYIEGLRPLIRSGGKLHTTFNQTLTSTGRLSSSEPNLQNLPVRGEEGREIRKMFVPENDILISADYSQIELRLLAHFSGDENLITAFNEGRDIHALVGSEIFGVPQEMITDNMRRTAKAVNFGIIYGISDFGLSQNIGIAPGKAKEYIRKYFASYPQIKSYLDSNIAFAKERGYVCTLTGRRRQLPEIKSTNFQIRSFGERAAMNMPLQGSAADIIKIAMINVHNALKNGGYRSKLILQVHDELVVDAAMEEKEAVETLLKKEMTDAFSLAVSLEVNIVSGENLYEAK